jgi:uncharacterized protein (TIGR02594 family)
VAIEDAITQTRPVLPDLSPPWMAYAKGKIGVHEIAGAHQNSYIIDILRATGISHDPGAPWCSAFVNDCMRAASITGTGKANARSWLDWGFALPGARYGCVVVLSRPPDPSHGHVAFYAGFKEPMFQLLGGNQHNEVCVAEYHKSRLLSYRWPIGQPVPSE